MKTDIDPNVQAVAIVMADGRERTTGDILRDAKLSISTRKVSEITKRLVKMGILVRDEPVTDFTAWRLRQPKEATS